MSEPTPTDVNRVRRIAKRRGLVLEKSRRRDPLALDYGTYWLNDATDNNRRVYGGEWGASLADCERFLQEGGRAGG